MNSTFVVTYVCFYVVKSCPVLVAPTRGMKASNDTSCDSTVEFSCDDCYELMGKSQLTCMPNQTWSGKEPNCNGQWLVVIYLHVERQDQNRHPRWLAITVWLRAFPSYSVCRHRSGTTCIVGAQVLVFRSHVSNGHRASWGR